MPIMYKDQSFCEASSGKLKGKPICTNTRCFRHSSKVEWAIVQNLGLPVCWADFSKTCGEYTDDNDS